MENITARLLDEGRTLQLTIDLTQSLGPSKSGRTTLIASSAGNQAVVDQDGRPIGCAFNLSVHRKPTPEEQAAMNPVRGLFRL
ncbi:MAG: hypothetical protein AB1646_24445 [Thermodesulfobacteriota bacterium]